MKFTAAVITYSSLTAIAFAQSETVRLPELSIYSPQVAIQDPVGTFAMPVSALRFEPVVDVQSRNLAEGQADISIRGGIFENTGFSVGAVSLYDAQTGHYFAEIPIAPAMLSAPEVITGADNSLRGWNANAGTVAYQWRPIRTAGALRLRAGQYDTQGAELYQGWVSDTKVLGHTFAVDASAAQSRSDGSRPFGESEFGRYGVRAQLATATHQTDLFYGYQRKYFGWPNLYVPFANVYETENIQTGLLVLNDRTDLGGGDFVAVGGYYRRNKDNYVFNRATPGAFNSAFATGPAFHTTWGFGGGIDSRLSSGEIHWHLYATFVDDEMKSTSLTWGPFLSREHFKLALAPERTWAISDGRAITLKAGITYSDTDRNSAKYAPLAELTIDKLAPSVGLNSAYLSYSEAQQVPTLFALNSRSTSGLFRGNPNLGWATSKNYELGLRGAQGSWSYNAAVFMRQDDSLVDWTYRLSLPNARSANAVDIDTTGFEAVLRYTSKSVDLVFGYTALTKDSDYGQTAVDASFYALNFAKHRLTAAATVRLGAGFEVRLDNEARIQEENALRKSNDEAIISSLGVYYAVPAVKGLKLSAEVENLWESEYQEVPAVPAARQQISFGVSYVW